MHTTVTQRVITACEFNSKIESRCSICGAHTGEKQGVWCQACNSAYRAAWRKAKREKKTFSGFAEARRAYLVQQGLETASRMRAGRKAA